MQDEVNERSVSLCVRGARMGAESLARTMRAFLYSRQRNRAAGGRASPSTGGNREGVMSMRALRATGAQLEKATLAEGGIGSIALVARKYRVAYSVMRDRSCNPPRWIVFFRAKDSAAMEAAFETYAKRVLDARERPSVIDKVRQMARNMPRPGRQERERDVERGAR